MTSSTPRCFFSVWDALCCSFNITDCESYWLLRPIRPQNPWLRRLITRSLNSWLSWLAFLPVERLSAIKRGVSSEGCVRDDVFRFLYNAAARIQFLAFCCRPADSINTQELFATLKRLHATSLIIKQVICCINRLHNVILVRLQLLNWRSSRYSIPFQSWELGMAGRECRAVFTIFALCLFKLLLTNHL